MVKESVVKTAKLRLREPSKRKKSKIHSTMEMCQEVAEFAANRMPSVPADRWYTEYDDVWARWYKDARELDSVDIQAQIAHKMVQNVRETFVSWHSNGCNGDRPTFNKENRIPYPASKFRFFKSNGTYYVNIPFGAGRGTRETFPFVSNKYNNHFLSRIVEADLEYGSGNLLYRNGRYMLHLSVKKEVDLMYEPKTFVGVDPGLNVLAWVVVVDENGTFVGQKHKGLGGGILREKIHEIDQRTSELQRNGMMFDEIKGKQPKKYVKGQFIETATRRIVDYTKQLDNPLIVPEYTDISQLRKATNNPDIHSWAAGDFRDRLIEKALWDGIQCLPINGHYTSQKCPNCGHIDDDNRKQNEYNGKYIDFKCVNCGYENHADFVGAFNLARRGAKLKPYAKAIFTLDARLRKRLMDKYEVKEIVGISRDKLEKVKGIGKVTAREFMSYC